MAHRVWHIACCYPLLLAVDSLAGYVTALQQTFHSPLPRQGPGRRPPLIAWPDIAIIQVVKQRGPARCTLTAGSCKAVPIWLAG